MIGKQKIASLMLSLFLIALFFFKLPNLYLIPYSGNPLLTTQSFARIFVVIIFIYKLLEYLINKKNIVSKKNKTVIFLILLLFFFQSISIIEAVNMQSFLNRYKDVILGICSFFVFFFYKEKYKLIIATIALSTLLNAAIETLLLFYTDTALYILSPFIYQNYLKLLVANLNRGRLYVPTYDEIIIPFLFLPTITRILKVKFAHIVIFLSVIFFALASNVRSNVLTTGVSLLGSLVVYRNLGYKKLALTIFGLLIIGYVVNSLLLNLVGFSFYDRLTFRNQYEDVNTVYQRVTQIGSAFEMSSSSLFGVGLGNYYDNLEIPKSVLVYSESRRTEVRDAREYVHNIFGTIAVESGFISLAIFALILVFLIRSDIGELKKGDLHKKAFIIAFWALFSWGLFNPPVSGTYQFLFWGIRGLLL